MLPHLYVNYGTITSVDLIENERRMDIPFDQAGAIETYFDQIEDAIKFAEAGASPFTMVQITGKVHASLVLDEVDGGDGPVVDVEVGDHLKI